MVSAMSSLESCTPEPSVNNKWKRVLVSALQQVQKQVHPSLQATSDALEYVEELIFQLLHMLCQQSQLHSVPEVKDCIQKIFPHPIDQWAMSDGQLAVSKKKSTLVLPVDKIHPVLKEELGYKVDNQVAVYIVAVLEYIAADILKLTGNYVKNMKHHEMYLQDIKIAMCADKVLMEMFYQDEDDDVDRREDEHAVTMVAVEKMTYSEIVKDLILEETQYVRDLNMIIKLFRDLFYELFQQSKDMETIFSNILDIHQLTCDFQSMLEDSVEATEENAIPMIGSCFEELAENQEFDIYYKFTEDRLNPSCRERLYALLTREDLQEKCSKVEPGFKDVVRYILPKLLLWPIYHFLKYLEVLSALQTKNSDREEQESLQNAYGLMHPLKTDMERRLGVCTQKRMQGEVSLLPIQRVRLNSRTTIKKMNEIQRSIDGWEGRDIAQGCREFIYEGALYKMVRGRQSERYVFLFDGLIVISKQCARRSVSGPQMDYKYKEKHNLRRLNVNDLEDNAEIKNAFEVAVKDAPSIIFIARSHDDKANWMAALLWQMKKSMLERDLDTKLGENYRNQPVHFTCPEGYKFGEEDLVGENIVFEENAQQTPGVEGPLIKGGTLVKLVERLTYHMYADLKYVRTFLITYRTFCRPQDLLDLLILRFEIPDPNAANGTSEEYIKTDSSSSREDMKRFRKEYAKPVQFRVLNVLRHWVLHHWYDFENNEDLQTSLLFFLESIQHKAMRKWAETIIKLINRQKETEGLEMPKNITFTQEKPTIEWHIVRHPGEREKFDLMTLHPVEIARQVTLLEFDLYRSVKPSEMVGSVWTKKQKNVTSQNLLKIFNFSTRFTFWLERCILEADNFEERVAVMTRVLEVMAVFLELNNFSGVLEVVGALNSASVHRLEWTFDEVRIKHHRLYKLYEEASEFSADHGKKYNERLRSINPPCVPFLGTYLTTILLTEEGNPDFLPNRPEGIINFSKRRKVAEICAEIQQYQNQHYCLEIEPEIRNFFETIDPLGEMSDKKLADYLYEKSLEIEPRNAKAPSKCERRREYNLKSPGIKSRAPSVSSLSTLTLRSASSHGSSLNRPWADDDTVSLCSRKSEFSTLDEEQDDVRTPTKDPKSLENIKEKNEERENESTQEEEPPPEIPPRLHKRNNSSAENSPLTLPLPQRTCFPFDVPLPSVPQTLDAPPLPPRSVPRRTAASLRTAYDSNTLPRSMFRQPPARPHPTALFQDCSAAGPSPPAEACGFLRQEGATGGFESSEAVNGEGSVSDLPELPPRTYRRNNIVHSRQQSS